MTKIIGLVQVKGGAGGQLSAPTWPVNLPNQATKVITE
jgi:hypothetical protein